MAIFYRKSNAQPSLFFNQRTDGFLRRLRSKKDLEEYLGIDEVFDFESFRPQIEAAVAMQVKPKKSKRGRPSFDPVFMAKALWLMHRLGQPMTKFSDNLLKDAVLQSVLDITFPDEVPSYQTLWQYNEYFAKSDLFQTLFDQQIELLHEFGVVPRKSARIVDSTFYDVPKQRNTRTENALIKAGKGQTLWNDNPHKQCHKDIDARWAKKHDVTHYGYKGHVNADSATKLIVGCNVTSASVHDSQVIVPLLSGYDIGSGRILFADAGYVGAKQSAQIFAAGMIPMICQKAFVGRPLTAEQEEDNHRFSKIRSRIEHIFGFLEGSMGHMKLRCIGLRRATHEIFFDMLVYNCARLRQLIRASQAKLPQPAAAN